MSRVQLPIWNPLAPVPEGKRQQASRLDIPVDLVARLAGQLGKRDNWQVMRRFVCFEACNTVTLYGGHLKLRPHRRRWLDGYGRQPDRARVLRGTARCSQRGHRQRHDTMRGSRHVRVGTDNGCRRHAIQLEGQVHGRCLRQATLPKIKAVGPVLHHAPPLLHVFGVVVGRTHPVRIGMGKLGIHPYLWITDFVQGRGNRGSNAVSGQQPGIAQPLQGQIERVLADALLQLAPVRQEVLLGRSTLIQQMADDIFRLLR